MRQGAHGRPAALRFSLATAWDLVLSAVAEHLNPTWRSTRPPFPEDERMFAATLVAQAARAFERAASLTKNGKERAMLLERARNCPES